MGRPKCKLADSPDTVMCDWGYNLRYRRLRSKSLSMSADRGNGQWAARSFGKRAADVSGGS